MVQNGTNFMTHFWLDLEPHSNWKYPSAYLKLLDITIVPFLNKDTIQVHVTAQTSCVCLNERLIR